MPGNQEQERLKRLRERQLAERNPLVKQRQFQHVTTQREKRLCKQFYTLGKIVNYKKPVFGQAFCKPLKRLQHRIQ